MTFESIQRSAKRLLSSLWFLSEYQTNTCFELSASLIGFFFLHAFLCELDNIGKGNHTTWVNKLLWHLGLFCRHLNPCCLFCMFTFKTRLCSNFRTPVFILWWTHRPPCNTTPLTNGTSCAIHSTYCTIMHIVHIIVRELACVMCIN